MSRLDRYREYSFGDAWTALENMLANGRADDVRVLLDANAALRAHLTVTDPPVYPGNLLLKAVKSDNGDLAKMRCLLAHGVDPDARDHRGLSVLERLFDTGTGVTPALVETLLKAGANPNGVSFGTPYLVRALRKYPDQVVAALLDAGADPNVVHQGTVPLALTIEHNRPGLAPLLLEAGASPEYAALVDPTFDPAALEHVPIKPPASLRARRLQRGARP